MVSNAENAILRYLIALVQCGAMLAVYARFSRMVSGCCACWLAHSCFSRGSARAHHAFVIRRGRRAGRGSRLLTTCLRSTTHAPPPALGRPGKRLHR